jgi:tetratricopeptide (TPR) repeat protein
MSKRKKNFDKRAPRARSDESTASARLLGVSAGIALIALIVFIAYLPSINGGFILDDDRLLTENELVRASDGMYRFWCTTESVDYWPATNNTFWIEWRLWGMNPAGYHVTNLILHVAEALLIWVILRKLSIPGAFWAAMLFALHPVNVEAAAWIAQRKDMLAVLFFLLSILWYLKADMPTVNMGMAPAPSARSQEGPWDREKLARRWLAAKLATLHSPLSTLHSTLWYWLSLAAFVLAMLSKGSVVILPAVLLGIVWWLRPMGTVPFRWSRRDLLRIAPFFAVAAALAGVNVWFQTHGTEAIIRSAGFAERLLGAGCTVWFYLFKAIVPAGLAFVYQQWRIEVGNPLWWLPLLAALAVTAALWRYRKSWSRGILFAWGFFCVSLVPVMGFTDVGFMQHSLVADHYQHIAIIGVIALVTAGFGLWRRRVQGGLRWAAPVVAIAAAGALAFLTWRQSGLYRDAATLYRFALEKNPDCWMIQNNMGKRLFETGRPNEAIGYYENAIRLNPDFPEARYNLGLALVETGRPREGIEQYEQALRLQPNYPEVLNNMGNALLQTGRPGESIGYYEKALRLKPDFLEVHNNLGAALARIGRPLDAIEHFKQALRLKSDDVDIWNNLTFAYADAHQSAEAVAAARKTLELARSQGQTVLAGQIEEWLKSYRSKLTPPPNAP